MPGLRAVLLHVETANRHFSRGRQDHDDTAFADVIYRCNQAFEGCIREAYRVLADQGGISVTLYDIEQYLDKHKVLRSRVIKQLSNYRNDWRNPSTHDYVLDFDESEAFIAMISATAFACLLIDQIIERLAFNQSKIDTTTMQETTAPDTLVIPDEIKRNLVDYVSHLIYKYCSVSETNSDSSNSKICESHTTGGLHGFSSVTAPELAIRTESRVLRDNLTRVDLLITRGTERLAIEIRKFLSRNNYTSTITHLEQAMLTGRIQYGIALFLPEKSRKLERLDIPFDSDGLNGTIVAISSAGKNPVLRQQAEAAASRQDADAAITDQTETE